MIGIGRVPKVFVSAGALLALVSCATVDRGDRAAVATAVLIGSDGSPAGSAKLLREGSGLVLQVNARGLRPGTHGLHLHTTGRCDPPGFTSAGGHWNPTSRQHGLADPVGPHAGDLPNLTADGSGMANLQVRLNDQANAAGLKSLFDADGTAVVIHAEADDLRTDPSGNSGDRIACGVLSRS